MLEVGLEVGVADGVAVAVVAEADGDAFPDGLAEVLAGDGVGVAVPGCFTVCVAPADLQALFAICVMVGDGDGEGEAVVLVGVGVVTAAGSTSSPPQPERTTTELRASAVKARARERAAEEARRDAIEALRPLGKTDIGPPWTEKRKWMRMHRALRYSRCGGMVARGTRTNGPTAGARHP